MKPIIGGLLIYLRKKKNRYLSNTEQTFIKFVLDIAIQRHGYRLPNEISDAIFAIVLLLLCCEGISKNVLQSELEKVFTLIIQRKMWMNRFLNPHPDKIGSLYILPTDCLLYIQKFI